MSQAITVPSGVHPRIPHGHVIANVCGVSGPVVAFHVRQRPTSRPRHWQ